MFVTPEVAIHRAQKKNLTDEERESQAQSLYSEFLSANDQAEALTLARELAAPGVPAPCCFVMYNFFVNDPLQSVEQRTLRQSSTAHNKGRRWAGAGT